MGMGRGKDGTAEARQRTLAESVAETGGSRMLSLNLDLNYFDHIKVKRLVVRLGNWAEVVPIKLWAQAGTYWPESGTLPITDVELEELCGWKGARGECIAALVELKFLVKSDKGWVINDWFDHEGHLSALKKRSQIANKTRWDRYRLQHCKDKVKPKDSNKDSLIKNKESLRNPLAVPCRAVPYKAIKEKETDRGVGATASPPPPPIIPIPDVLLDLPEYAKDKRLCAGLPAATMAWEKAYPGVSVNREIRKAYAWEMADPRRRKVLRLKFLQAWMARSQDNPKYLKEDTHGAPHDSPSVPDLKALARKARLEREAARVREQAAAGTVPDGVRDSDDVPYDGLDGAR